MRANLPENEAARLSALRDYHILDTLPEQAFDDITLLASQICGTPIALVSLIDQDRQWFKSKQGLEATETPRDLAFCAHALLQPHELLIVPDARQDERFADNPFVTGAPHIQFYVGAPLVSSRGDTLGTLCVIDHQPRELSESQRHTLRVLARQVMAQMELRRNLEELANQMAMRVQIEAALRESEGQFRAFMDNSPLVAFLKDDKGRFTYVNQLFLQRFDKQADEIIGKDDFELWPEVASQLREHDLSVLAGDATVGLIETVPMSDGQTHYWQVYKFPLQRGGGDKRYLAGVALDITENKLYEQRLEESQVKLEAALKQVEAQSLTDSLTGLNNRRAFDRRFEEEFSRAARYQLPLSLLMIDVDKFKGFNDSFGHPAGDEVLQHVARLLQEKSRLTDFVARYGGEEFVIILPNTAGEGAVILAERFCREVEKVLWSKRAVTVSIGIGSFAPAMTQSAALLEAADQALYAAKARGRNCVMKAPNG